MGAPQMELPELEGLCPEFGMDFLELRTLAGTTALPDYFRKRPDLARNSIFPVRVVSTNLRLAEAMPKDIDAFLEFARLADALGAPYVRVFGGGGWEKPLPDGFLEQAAINATRCRDKMSEAGVRCEMLLETHSAFSSAELCARLCEQAPGSLFILWDSHHTWKLAGETLEESWRTIGAHVRHIHYKDSRSIPSGRHPFSYVLPGTGEFPSLDLLRLLAAQNYTGGVSLEWERLWHPELPALSKALSAFQALLREAG